MDDGDASALSRPKKEPCRSLVKGSALFSSSVSHVVVCCNGVALGSLSGVSLANCTLLLSVGVPEPDSGGGRLLVPFGDCSTDSDSGREGRWSTVMSLVVGDGPRDEDGASNGKSRLLGAVAVAILFNP